MKDYQNYLNKLYKIYDELFVWTGLPMKNYKYGRKE